MNDIGAVLLVFGWALWLTAARIIWCVWRELRGEGEA